MSTFAQPVIYSTGLHRTDSSRVVHRLSAHQHLLASTSAEPRGQTLLTPAMRMQQGKSNTCHAHSLAGGLWTACNAAGKPLAWLPSPLFIASCTYADMRAANTPEGVQPALLKDTGAQLQDDADAVRQWGICPMGALVPGRDGVSDIPDDPADLTFPEVNQTEAEIAGSHLISGEYSIPVDSSAAKTAALCLDNNVPVWLGTFVDTAFMQLGATGIAQPANENDPNGGGHAMYLSGYSTVDLLMRSANTLFQQVAKNALAMGLSSDDMLFRDENSWGTGWADGGAVWVPESWLRACWDLMPLAVAA